MVRVSLLPSISRCIRGCLSEAWPFQRPKERRKIVRRVRFAYRKPYTGDFKVYAVLLMDAGNIRLGG
jgi:hypothetical protein